MAANFIQEGRVLTVAAPYDVTSGVGVRVGKLFGIAQYDALSTVSVTIDTQGVYNVAKVSAQAWAVGEEIYWDDSAKLFTSVTTSPNIWVGVATAVAANPTSVGYCRLNGFPIQDPEVTSG